MTNITVVDLAELPETFPVGTRLYHRLQKQWFTVEAVTSARSRITYTLRRDGSERTVDYLRSEIAFAFVNISLPATLEVAA